MSTVLYESKERVATLTLNRPERMNAIKRGSPRRFTRGGGAR
jgi:enoyl-CoA hydratase/carnithine racemase